MTPSPLISFEKVCLQDDGGRVLFQDTTWTLPTGMRLRLPSGSGASALLRLSCGILDAHSGRVFLDQVPLGPYSFNHPYLRKGLVGWLPSDGGLLVNLNLRANLAMPLRFLRGLNRMEAEVQAQASLEELDMGHLAELRPHAVDLRHRWMTGLLRALSLHPRLYLIDHPPSLEDAERDFALKSLGEALADPSVSLILACPGAPFCTLTEQSVSFQKGHIIPAGGNP